jgi:hypothetical protein
MHGNNEAERTAYYRRQASACAAAAVTTPVAEIRQAYLNLEQGWLCLAPKTETGPSNQNDPGPARTTETTSEVGGRLSYAPPVAETKHTRHRTLSD